MELSGALSAAAQAEIARTVASLAGVNPDCGSVARRRLEDATDLNSLLDGKAAGRESPPSHASSARALQAATANVTVRLAVPSGQSAAVIRSTFSSVPPASLTNYINAAIAASITDGSSPPTVQAITTVVKTSSTWTPPQSNTEDSKDYSTANILAMILGVITGTSLFCCAVASLMYYRRQSEKVSDSGVLQVKPRPPDGVLPAMPVESGVRVEDIDSASTSLETALNQQERRHDLW